MAEKEKKYRRTGYDQKIGILSKSDSDDSDNKYSLLLLVSSTLPTLALRWFKLSYASELFIDQML